MSASGFVKFICTAPLLALFAGCTLPEQKGRPGVAETARHASTRARFNPDGEARAVWISSGYFNSDEEKAVAEIESTLDTYAGIGINHLLCFSALPSQHERDWDFLPVLLRAAHARGMKVHPCFCPGHLYPAWKEEIIEEHPEWLLKNIKENSPSLNLALPEVREFVIGKVSAALRYDVDGVHLDGIRFQTGQGFSYDDATCQAFKRRYGRGPLELRWHNSGSVIWCEWMRWNTLHVTALVKGVRDAIEKSGRQIPLSAAVFPDHESAKLLVGQDWQKWAGEGLVDILCPMVYTRNHEVFEKYVKRAVEAADGKCLVWPGIAVVTSHAKNTPAGLVEQIKIARRAGADGVAFFSGASLKEEFIDELQAGVFNEK